MNTAIRKLLRRYGLYYRLKYSACFRLYQRIFKPADTRREKAEISFYQSFLPHCQLVFDIGANDGHKTAAFLHIADRVVSCEPDAENYNQLQIRFRKLAKRVIVERVALAETTGSTKLLTHHAGSAFNTLSDKWKTVLESDQGTRWNEVIRFSGIQEVNCTTLDALIEKYGVPGFIKLDVEGYEEKVLKGLSCPVAFLSFETLLPDYAVELENCISRVEVLGSPAKYNVAIEERLLWDQFVGLAEFRQNLKTIQSKTGFEVIVKMSE
jgi:FkbM family methyltransferase